MQVFGMSSLDSTPSNTELFQRRLSSSSFQRRNVLLFAVKELLNWFVNLSLTMNPQSKRDKTWNDHVQEYGPTFDGVCWFNLRGGWGEKYTLVECSSRFLRHKSDKLLHWSLHPACSAWFQFYTKDEATVGLGANCKCAWSSRKNIPCDLYMEHLNHESKGTIGSLGPNVSSVNGCTDRKECRRAYEDHYPIRFYQWTQPWVWKILEVLHSIGPHQAFSSHSLEKKTRSLSLIANRRGLGASYPC